jgi:hypothetical protein
MALELRLLECGGAPPLFVRRRSSNKKRTAALAIFLKRQNTRLRRGYGAAGCRTPRRKRKLSHGTIFSREPQSPLHPDELTTALNPQGLVATASMKSRKKNRCRQFMTFLPKGSNPLGSSLRSSPEAERRLSRRSLGEGGPVRTYHAFGGELRLGRPLLVGSVAVTTGYRPGRNESICIPSPRNAKRRQNPQNI